MNKKREIRQLLEKAALKRVAYNYTYELLKVYSRDYETFQKICEKYEVEEKELLQLLSKNDSTHLQIYDDLLENTYKLEKIKK